ncbi:MAG: hypothetical protein A2096_12625 [Spirochaetes bacterium GWF1_41_5]|nr:MAG: hypothetical protein A2096_12625 [Spirochaetes bacterium GWF1_41_5]
MQKTGILLLFLAYTMGMLFSQKTIAIMTFDDPKVKITDKKGRESQDDKVEGTGSLASDLLLPYLMKVGTFNVLEREQIAKVMKEQEMGAAGMTKGAAEIGNLLGADYLLTGSVTKIAKKSGIGVRAKVPCSILGCIFGGIPGLVFLLLPVKGYEAFISVKMVDAKTGALKWTTTEKANRSTIQDTIDRAMRNISRDMVKAFKKMKV